MIEGDHRDHPSGLDASYILPLRRHHGPPSQELTSYLRWLAPRVDLVVVDGSPDLVRRAHAEAWRNLPLRHVAPDAGVATLNGKVAGVLTGLRLARCDRVIVADDDVRYDETALRRVVALLDTGEVVRPQNYFDPGTPAGTRPAACSTASPGATIPARSPYAAAPSLGATTAMSSSRTSS